MLISYAYKANAVTVLDQNGKPKVNLRYGKYLKKKILYFPEMTLYSKSQAFDSPCLNRKNPKLLVFTRLPVLVND